MKKEETGAIQQWQWVDVDEKPLVGLSGQDDFAAVSDDEVVGYCSFGRNAMIPHYIDEEHFVGVAWGLRPSLVGAGKGTRFVKAIVAFGSQKYRPRQLQAVIKRCNARSLRASENAGFVPVDEVGGKIVLQRQEEAIDVSGWLREDVGDGDLTSLVVIDEGTTCEAELRLNEPGVVCGLEAAAAVFEALGATLELLAAEGDWVEPGPIARVSGPARAVLSGERLALNLVGRLSGIATLTRRYVSAVAGSGAEILDTRKTTPGLRALEKHAVRCGGGRNHRLGLYDGILIKDNHLRVAGSLADAVRRARGRGVPVEVECDTLDQVEEALAAGADRILLDNMPPPMLARSVALVDGRAELEASGGVTLETVRAIAETGIDFISVGALTHSARSLDVSLEVA